MATLVVIVTVIATYHSIGTLVGHETAVDGAWSAVFLANVHYQATDTNYLLSQAPPSPLLNYWSLGVEEQFYIVYPVVVVLLGWWARRGSFRLRLTVFLVAVIIASYSYSIVFTASNAQSAYFSLLVRSWELALGGLIAVYSPQLQRIPQAWAAVASWVGLAVILVASVTLTPASEYPGALVAIPTLAAGLVIAAGAAAPTWGVERLLRREPFPFLALISFSLYLWHWPILEIAAQHRGVTTLPVWDNVLLLVLAGLLATVTYRFFENPVRHAKFLVRRKWTSLIMGLCLIVATLAVTTYEQRRPTVALGAIAQATSGSICRSPSSSDVARLRSTYTPNSSGEDSKSEQLKSVVVVGDSTACSLLIGLQAVGPSYGMQFENGAVIGCGIVSGVIAPFYVNDHNVVAYTTLCQGQANRAESLAIERYHPSLILWGSTDERSSIVVNTAHGTKVLTSGSPEWKSVMLERMDTRVKKFLATGARVVLTLAPPAVHTSGTTASALLVPAAHSPGRVDSDDENYAHMNSLLKEVAAKHPRQVAVVDLSPRVCPLGPPCQYVVPAFNPHPTSVTQTVRADGIHYLPNGSLWVARWLVPQIAQAAKGLS